MGMLTTITFRNDAFHDMKAHPEETMRKILGAMQGQQVDDNEMVSQRPVHSDENAIYVCSGNTTTDVSYPEGARMMGLLKRIPDFFGDLMVAVKVCADEFGQAWAQRHKL